MVKVQRPSVARLVRKDLRVMAWLAPHLVGRIPIAALANPPALVELFAETIVEELDFRMEAANMLDIAVMLHELKQTGYVVPRPHPSLVTRRVLVMERLDGFNFDDVVGMKDAGVDTEAVVRTAMVALMEGAMIYGVFHGDLHGGNLFVLPDGRTALLDFGIVGRLTGERRLAFLRMMVGATTNDVKGQLAAMRDLGALPADTDLDAVIRDLRLDQAPIDPDHAHRRGAGRRGPAGGQGAARLRRASMPKELMLYVKNMVFLDGAMARLAPDLDLLAEIANISMLFAERHGEHLGRELGHRPDHVGDQHGRREGRLRGRRVHRAAHLPRAAGAAGPHPEADARPRRSIGSPAVSLDANARRFSGFADLYDAVRPVPPARRRRCHHGLCGWPPRNSSSTLAVELVCRPGGPAAGRPRSSGSNPVPTCARGLLRFRATQTSATQPGWSNATALPDRCADVVLAVQALHWMEPTSTFVEVARLLRPGGVFAAVDCDWPPSVGNARAEQAWHAARATIAQHERELAGWSGESSPPRAASSSPQSDDLRPPASVDTAAASAVEIADGAQYWHKGEHLGEWSPANSSSTAVEIAALGEERGDCDRFVQLFRSQGDYQALRRHGIDDRALGIDQFAAEVEAAIGTAERPFWFTYRARIGVRCGIGQ